MTSYMTPKQIKALSEPSERKIIVDIKLCDCGRLFLTNDKETKCEKCGGYLNERINTVTQE